MLRQIRFYTEKRQSFGLKGRKAMYECPNCGGNLKFDIASQQMGCAYCGGYFDPYSLKKETDAREEGGFDTTVFTCPQCGGELYSTDQDATSFCSFCGAATILSKRLERMQRPKYIIPFQKTKEDCKRAYEKRMRQALFAPSRLKDPQYIDGFRGIYMPYWTYQVIQKGEISLKGESTTREGNYICTAHYDLLGDLDSYYLGYSCDASSSFYDDISENLAPYDAKALVKFTPAFLSGFYADTADVASEVYEEDAKEQANQHTYRCLWTEKEFASYSPEKDEGDALTKKLHTRIRMIDSTMYPVWFLTYRNEDRVAYVAVNGQTGKVVADLPVDPKKYLLGSLLLALPLFLLLNLFLTLRPPMLLGIGCLLCFLVTLICERELRIIRRMEHNEGDRGMEHHKREGQSSAALKEREEKKEEGKKKKISPKKKIGERKIFPVIFWTVVWIPMIICFFSSLKGILQGILVYGSTIGIGIVEGKRFFEEDQEGEKHWQQLSGRIACVLGILAAVVITFFRPVSDLYYYGGTLVLFGAILYRFAEVIRNYNRIAMRRLPQFDRRGGDDRA